MIRRLAPAPALLALGIGAWALGVGELRPSTTGLYGLLADGNVWFAAGFALLLACYLVELCRGEARGWMLALCLVTLIVAIHATVPIVYRAPEYPWVYKHIGVAQALGQHGRVTDATSIYQEWPAFFSAVAALTALGHVSALTYATWAPLAFEIADALVLFAVFRLLGVERRAVYLALLLYEGLVSWIGQDYLSPQAFGYLLWLGVVLIVVRWLRTPVPARERVGRLARLQAPFARGTPVTPDVARARRAVALVLVAVVYFTIVAAHQLTPYVALAGIGALTILDLVRPRWLLLLLAALAGGFLVTRYHLISTDFGGLFSGGNPIANASGSRGTSHAGAEATTARVVRLLAAAMWLLSLAAIWRRRRELGRVAYTAALAFSPFVVLAAQSYGGEAIYRVYLFSAPWCALLIGAAVWELRRPVARGVVAVLVSGVMLFAGLQGLYGPASVNAVTPGELAASSWLYAHLPSGSLIVLPVDDFPVLQTAAAASYPLQLMPSDPQDGPAWLDEANLPEVERWITDLGHSVAYVAVSRSMTAHADYFGAPAGFATLRRMIDTAPGWSVAYRNPDATIYRVSLPIPARTTARAAPAPAATTPASTARARAGSPRRR